MKALVKAEGRKALASRSTFGITAAMLVIVALGVLQTMGASASESGRSVAERQFYLLAMVNVRLVAGLLGVKLITDEFRYGTITPSLLASPRRVRFAAAKAVTAAAAGLAAGLAATAAMAAIALPRMAADGTSLGAADVRALVGIPLAAAVWSTIGAAVGFAVRHQLAAFAGMVAYAFMIEELVAGRLSDAFAGVLPAAATAAIAVAPGARAWLASVVVVAWLAAILAGATAAFRRVDVT